MCTLPNNGTCKNEIATSSRFLIEMIAKLERTQIISTLVETKTGHSTSWLNNYNIILYLTIFVGVVCAAVVAAAAVVVVVAAAAAIL